MMKTFLKKRQQTKHCGTDRLLLLLFTLKSTASDLLSFVFRGGPTTRWFKSTLRMQFTNGFFSASEKNYITYRVFHLKYLRDKRHCLRLFYLNHEVKNVPIQCYGILHFIIFQQSTLLKRSICFAVTAITRF